MRDAIGRLWQCSTIQCDFNLPERFQLEYVTKEGHRNRPIMVHRAIFGSLERFFGILLENCAGDLPLWLAPVQLRWIGLSEEARTICHKYREYAEQVSSVLLDPYWIILWSMILERIAYSSRSIWRPYFQMYSQWRDRKDSFVGNHRCQGVGTRWVG